MNAVLGTRIEPLRAAAERALLVSDLHIGSDGGAPLQNLRHAVAAAAAERAALLVLGDLFDSYVARAQVRHGVWREVAALFAEAVAGGVPVAMLVGNRDFLLGDEFATASRVQLAHGGLRGMLGGVDTLLLHGDELCQNDVPYQRAKRWLRHPATRWLARHLPLRLAFAVAERARRKSRMVVAAGDQTRFLPTRSALGQALGVAPRLVFGHVHRRANGRLGDGEYWVLPAGDAEATGLWLGPGEARLVRVQAGGRLSPEPHPGEASLAP